MEADRKHPRTQLIRTHNQLLGTTIPKVRQSMLLWGESNPIALNIR